VIVQRDLVTEVNQQRLIARGLEPHTVSLRSLHFAGII
jgi:hypothetical protein